MTCTDHFVEPEDTDEITCDDIPKLMGEIRIMAQQLLRKEGRAQSLRATSLVNTAFRRQPRQGQSLEEMTWKNRDYFMGSVYKAMKRALVDKSRKRTADKRGDNLPHLDIDDLLNKDVRSLAQASDPMTEALLSSLERLADLEPRWAEAIYHHFFGGFTLQETAVLMDIDVKTLSKWRRRAYDMLREDMLDTLNGEA